MRFVEVPDGEFGGAAASALVAIKCRSPAKLATILADWARAAHAAAHGARAAPHARGIVASRAQEQPRRLLRLAARDKDFSGAAPPDYPASPADHWLQGERRALNADHRRWAVSVAGDDASASPSAADGCFRLVFDTALTRGRPQPVSDLQRLDNSVAGPPGPLITGLMQRIVVPVAQRHGELVRHLETERPLLGEANMVRLRGPAAAHEAGLAGNEGEMVFIANAFVLGDEQLPRRWWAVSGVMHRLWRLAPRARLARGP